MMYVCVIDILRKKKKKKKKKEDIIHSNRRRRKREILKDIDRISNEERLGRREIQERDRETETEREREVKDKQFVHCYHVHDLVLLG